MLFRIKLSVQSFSSSRFHPVSKSEMSNIDMVSMDSMQLHIKIEQVSISLAEYESRECTEADVYQLSVLTEQLATLQREYYERTISESLSVSSETKWSAAPSVRTIPIINMSEKHVEEKRPKASSHDSPLQATDNSTSSNVQHCALVPLANPVLFDHQYQFDGHTFQESWNIASYPDGSSSNHSLIFRGDLKQLVPTGDLSQADGSACFLIALFRCNYETFTQIPSLRQYRSPNALLLAYNERYCRQDGYRTKDRMFEVDSIEQVAEMLQVTIHVTSGDFGTQSVGNGTVADMFVFHDGRGHFVNGVEMNR